MCDAIVISQIDEQEITVIAGAVNPAGEAGFLARMSRAQFDTSMRAIEMHVGPVSKAWKNRRRKGMV